MTDESSGLRSREHAAFLRKQVVRIQVQGGRLYACPSMTKNETGRRKVSSRSVSHTRGMGPTHPEASLTFVQNTIHT